MADHFNQLRDMLMTFPSVVERQNDFGTKHAYFYRNREFAHFHSEDQLDIQVARQEIEEIAPEAIENPFSSDWVLFNIRSEQDARKALFLLKKAYEKVA